MAAPSSVQRASGACSRYYLTPGLCSPTVRRASSTASVHRRRNLAPNRQTGRQATSLSSTRQAFKSWTKTSTDKESDSMFTMSRLASVLNLDIPQVLQKIQAITPSKFSYRKNDDASVSTTNSKQSSYGSLTSSPGDKSPTKKSPRVHAIHRREEVVESSTTNIPPPADKTSMALQVVEADEHDFATAMTQMNTSVTDYHTASQKSKQDAIIQANRPFNKPPSVIRKEMQRSFRQQIADLLPYSLIRRTPKPEQVIPQEQVVASPKFCKSTIDKRTKGLVLALRKAETNKSRLTRLEDLCKHLEVYPQAKNLAVREKGLGALLKLRHVPDSSIQLKASEALTLVGWTDPVKGPGIRVLSIDGGGTRGLVTLEILKRIEATTGQPIHKQFDLVSGVSTGALLALMIGVFRLPLDEAESIYKVFSREMFTRHPIAGASGVLTSHSYYDTPLWENILKENVGWKSFFETAQDPDTCKIACVSALINLEKIQNFLFRNYTYPHGVASQYPGSMRAVLWQAIRASSAAPGYYEEFRLGEFVHQDGGVLTNNPSAIALHECRCLWPDEQIHCVVSMGNGRYEPTGERLKPTPSLGIKHKINHIVQSATDTEAVHTVLNDLLPPQSYFRFNPFMTQEFTLDEIREARWEQMQHEARMYCRKNQYKIDKLAERLAMPRTKQQNAADWLKMKNIMRDS